MEKEIELGNRQLSIATGDMAFQADGSCLVKYGDTVVLSTACFSRRESDFMGFIPLTCDYRERAYAAGKIPGGFFKREGRPTEKEILSSRLMDRPIRPLLSEHLRREVQLISTVLSQDGINDADILGVIGASLSLAISPIPFTGPVGAVRIGRLNGEFVINPSFGELAESELNLVAVGTKKGITTIEAGAHELKESLIIEALRLAEGEIEKIIELQERIISVNGKEKISLSPESYDDIEKKIREIARGNLEKLLKIPVKKERSEKINALITEVKEEFDEEYENIVNYLFDKLESEIVRENIKSGMRIDGRKSADLRNITCEVGILPRTHGSAIFRRGETQALCTVTLGTMADEQRIEALEGQSFKSFMLHYNFPPFSVGEVKRMFNPGRREIGHGALAEKAISTVLPPQEIFPYTIRIVSDILASNGSSSMATVCGGALALMDAGVPLKCNVAGIAMGLIDDIILTDITGEEDHYGDMDFKVVGTLDGITALQLDIKKESIDIQTLSDALAKAKETRMEILKVMNSSISSPREEISQYAPKLRVISVPKEKIGQVIGPGGKVIRNLCEESGANIEINDEGKVFISGETKESVELAEKLVKQLVEEVEVGKVYLGTVKRILPFGAFVEILPGKDGMIHISQLAHHRVKSVEDELKIGEEVKCKVIGIDEQGRVQLSKKAVE
ncbi:polyribonucleotide nucleotidyltransferase [candidate division WOR-3 bacterium JGI_Cruoil_03_44_89]|uniref:Polyribonucleotide nucleotidyltransferase n=1 Tax=candidate division WOR-3 bacterium JGI_Cruoil_03_44_89 TaxID=1973748 RepID=A0A235BSD5_UNCW3|nr:MAG: polyribonucleotide nucleotidyltransferase [candidate division WOR-3 bacterium JGI_Cruoil_03_44_89]